MRSNYRKLGEFIAPAGALNNGMEVDNLLGISNAKYFQKAKTNTIGINLEKYRIVRKGQFAFNRATTRNGDKISIALREESDCIVSPSYRIFEVVKTDELIPEYLMMWFRRSEFDRYARYKSHGSAHEFFEYDDMCEIELPVPSIEKQASIVKEYKTTTERIKLNEQLNQKLEETAQAIYKEWFVDFEFPDENGKPYKSSGGEMEYCDELGVEVPKGWITGTLSDIMEYSKGKVPLSELNTDRYISTENMIENRGGVTTSSVLPIAEKVSKFETNNILISNIRPYFKKIWLAEFNGGCSNDILCIKAKNINPLFLYFILEQDNFFDYVMAGSKGTKMPRGDKDWILQYPIVIPKEEQLRAFSKITSHLKLNINTKIQLTKYLKELSDTLLSKMATIEG